MQKGTRYSAQEGRWYGKRRSNKPLSENDRDERVYHTDMGNGMVRVDIGAPIHRLPGEPQPVAVRGAPVRRELPPEPAPAVDITPLLPPDLRTALRDPREFKPGLGNG